MNGREVNVICIMRASALCKRELMKRKKTYPQVHEDRATSLESWQRLRECPFTLFRFAVSPFRPPRPRDACSSSGFYIRGTFWVSLRSGIAQKSTEGERRGVHSSSARAVQSSAKRLFPGCVKLDEKLCFVYLLQAGERNFFTPHSHNLGRAF